MLGEVYGRKMGRAEIRADFWKSGERKRSSSSASSEVLAIRSYALTWNSVWLRWLSSLETRAVKSY